MSNYFSTLIKSLNPKNYSELIKHDGGSAFGFFWITSLLYALIFSIVVGATVYNFNLRDQIDAVLIHYPEDLVLTFGPETWSINQPLPYALNFAPELRVLFLGEDQIDTSLLSDFQIILTPNYLHIREAGGHHQVSEIEGLFRFENYGSFSFDRDNIYHLMNRFFSSPFMANRIYIPIIAIGVYFAFFIAFSFGTIVTLLLLSLVAWLVATFVAKNKALTYGKILKISFYSMVILVIIDALQYLPMLSFGGGFFINPRNALVLAWMLIVTWLLSNKTNTEARKS
ncbi:MAG: DUF1189 domain-containing protein [Pseudomonadales bacterium]|jgi:hypothetical protein|nr:DUF1189 domain-containing protein [Pseudomonadales bacterium]